MINSPANTPTSAPETAPEIPLPVTPEPGCVLVVEDDPMLRRVVVRILKSWGFEILEAIDGGAALEQVDASHAALNVVLLDIMLPVLSGVDVARKVLQDRPDLPIVACSADLNPEVETKLRDAGVRHFLPKPYTADTLRDSLARAMTA